MNKVHFHIRSWTTEKPTPPFSERVKGPNNKMEWYRYFVVYQGSYPSLSWALARCAVAAGTRREQDPAATDALNFYPIECTGAYCHGKHTLRTFSSEELDPGYAVRRDQVAGQPAP